jgi:alkylhydroperoxidase family enzyme
MRLKGLEEHEAPFVARPAYWLSRKMLGKVITPLKVQARRPGIMWFGNLLGTAIEKSGKIELPLRALAQLRTAQLIGCPF